MANKLTFNPFTSNFDFVGGGSASIYWLSPVANFASLPLTDTDGATRVVLNEDAAYTFDSGSTTWVFTGKVKLAAVGSAPNANGYSVAVNNALTLQPADATHPGVIANAAQTIPGLKTFPSQINADGGVDLSAPGSLAIGTSTNAGVINIGNSGATINIQGTTLYENVTQLQVSDPLITLNHGGGTGSAANSGVELEENASITAYVKTSGDRNSWTLKAPNTAGIATITAGAGGILLNQSSHDPVTLAAVGSVPNANSATLSNQVLNLQPADGSFPGVVTAGTQTIGGNKTFNGSITAANLSGTNTGDITLTAVGVVPSANGASLSGQALTLQPADGTHPGLITSSTQTLGGDKTFTGNISALNLSGTNTGDQTITLTGDVTGSGTSSFATTISANAVDNSKLAQMSANTIKGNNTGSTANALDLTVTQVKTMLGFSPGDLPETSFSLSNNQASPANITGLAFANGTVRGFEALVSVFINASSSLYEIFTLRGIQKGSSWDMSVTSNGDISQVVFSITSAGQIQYVDGNYSGFTAGLLKFRAITVSI